MNDSKKIDKRYKIKVGSYYRIVMNGGIHSYGYSSRECKVISKNGDLITLERIGTSPIDNPEKGIYKTVCDDQVIDGKVFTKHVSWLISNLKYGKAWKCVPPDVANKALLEGEFRRDKHKYRFRVGDRFHIIPHYGERIGGPPSIYLTIVSITDSKIILKRMGNSHARVKLYDNSYMEGNTFGVDRNWFILAMMNKNVSRTEIGELL